ncbi:hypothetical protein BHM03_00056149, partial [Ensete ventricosum]
AYISYRVITRVNLCPPNSPLFCLDTCVMYPEKFRFSTEFIEMRRQALDMFINRIASHPELKQSEDLRTFLQEDEEV